MIRTGPKWLERSLKFGLPALINIGSVGVAFATRLLVARLIGAAAFGTFSIWQNNVILFGTLGAFGQQNQIIRDLAQEHNSLLERKRLVSAGALKLTMLISVLSAVAAAVVFICSQGGDWGGAGWQTGSIIAYGLMITLSSLHRGLGSITVGICFDRVVYPVGFIIALLLFAAFVGGSNYAIPLCALTIIAGAICSLMFLRHELSRKVWPEHAPASVWSQVKLVAPYFAVAALFAVNGRYLLVYSGMLFTGALLGEVSLIFALASVIVIPAATLNLLLGPTIARQLAKQEEADRAATKHLARIAGVTSISVLAVYFTYPLAFKFAHIETTLDPSLVALLATSMGVTVVGNCLLLTEQYLGNAGIVAWYFGVSTVAKLLIGYWMGARLGLGALAIMDLAIGSIFLIAMLARLVRLVSHSRRHRRGQP